MWYAKAEASVCYAVWGSGSVDIQAEDRVIFHSAWKIDGPKVWREFGLASRRRHLTWSMLSIYLGPIFDPWRKTGNSFSLPSPPSLKVPICERHDCTVSRCWGWMKAPGTIDLRWFQRGWRGSAEPTLPDVCSFHGKCRHVNDEFGLWVLLDLIDDIQLVSNEFFVQCRIQKLGRSSNYDIGLRYGTRGEVEFANPEIAEAWPSFLSSSFFFFFLCN